MALNTCWCMALCIEDDNEPLSMLISLRWTRDYIDFLGICNKCYILYDIISRLLKTKYVFILITIEIIIVLSLVQKVFLHVPQISKTLSTSKFVKLVLDCCWLTPLMCVAYHLNRLDGINVHLVFYVISLENTS